MATGKIIKVSGAELLTALWEQYKRLERESNPRPPTWNDYLSTVLSIGLEQLRTMSDAEALALLEKDLLRESRAAERVVRVQALGQLDRSLHPESATAPLHPSDVCLKLFLERRKAD